MNKELLKFTEPGVFNKIMKLAVETKGLLSLAVGQPDFLPPKNVLEAIKNASDFKYPSMQGKPKLLQVISDKLNKENKIKSLPHEIFVTQGGTEAINLVMKSLLNKKDICLTPNPGFLIYAPIANLYGKNVYYNNLDDLEKKAKKAKLLIINSPSNPTGKVYSKEEIDRIAKIVEKHNLHVISDEVYEYFVYEGEHHSLASNDKIRDKVITINSLSKSYAIPGLRIGYLHTTNKELMNILKTMHLYTTVGASSISQEVAINALTKTPKSYMENVRNEYKKRRDIALKIIDENNFLSCEKPNGAFYIFIKTCHINDVKYVLDLIKEKNILVTPGSIFGPKGEGYVRISYASPIDTIKKALEKL